MVRKWSKSGIQILLCPRTGSGSWIPDHDGTVCRKATYQINDQNCTHAIICISFEKFMALIEIQIFYQPWPKPKFLSFWLAWDLNLLVLKSEVRKKGIYSPFPKFSFHKRKRNRTWNRRIFNLLNVAEVGMSDFRQKIKRFCTSPE